MQLHGLHHVTAISADARACHAFYTGVMGMRLVKKTVNQDDVRAYHLFFADGAGSPGTDLTFFEFPVPPETRGTHSVSRTGLRVADGESLAFWAERFRHHGVSHQPVREVDGHETLDFEDPEGQRFRLITDGGAGDFVPWERADVPAAHQIRGLGPAYLSVPDLRPTATFLSRVYEIKEVRSYASPDAPKTRVHVFSMGAGGVSAELHIAVEPHLPIASQGAGAVHHIALRARDEDEYAYWVERYRSLGLRSSGPVDRFYFRSLYVREPNGVLIEIATDGPGFATDESAETMGESLSLPPFLEAKRPIIEAGLKPL
jgi:glyoxalase family protein